MISSLPPSRSAASSPIEYRPALQSLPRTLRYGSLLAGATILAGTILTALVGFYLTTHALIFPRPMLQIGLANEGTSIHPMDVVQLSAQPTAGRQLTYSWTFDDGASASGQRVTHQYATYGYFAVTVTAHDPVGQSGSAHLDVTVLPDPPPQAAAKVVSQGANGVITLDGSASTGVTLNYNWDFGDGSQSWGPQVPQVTHTYAHPGHYTVTLTVIDVMGQSSAVQLAVTAV